MYFNESLKKSEVKKRLRFYIYSGILNDKTTMFTKDKFLDTIRKQVREREDAKKNIRMYPVKLPEGLYLQAKVRALDLDLSLNKYFRRLVEVDVEKTILKKY